MIAEVSFFHPVIWFTYFINLLCEIRPLSEKYESSCSVYSQFSGVKLDSLEFCCSLSLLVPRVVSDPEEPDCSCLQVYSHINCRNIYN